MAQIVLQAPNILGKDFYVLNIGLLFAANSVDHDIITINVKGTFHEMGMIAYLTVQIIPRHKTTEQNVVEKSKVE